MRGGVKMGLFRRSNKDEAKKIISDQVGDLLLKALIENEKITRENAMTLPAVSGAVDLISSSIASMPVRLYKYKNGKVEEVEGDPRTKMLNGDTGDTLDGYQLKKAIVEDYLMDGNGYAYIRRRRNEVTGLFYVRCDRLFCERNFRPIFKDYVINVEGRTYEPWQFIKMLRNTRDGSTGTGLTDEVGKVLETAYQTLLYELKRVKSGGAKKGFLQAEHRLSKDEVDVLKSSWAKLYTGWNKEDNAVVLNNGITFKEASATSTELQLNESSNRLQQQINDLFHISNDFDLTFKLAIFPIVKAFETSLNRDLLLEKEKNKMFFEFDIKEIIRANLKERYESYKLAKETGFMTINEIRRAENMNYIEGMDVINVGLGAVLYEVNTGKYYTPNTDTISDPNDPEEKPTDAPDPKTPDPEAENDMLEAHEEEVAFEESGNSSDA